MLIKAATNESLVVLNSDGREHTIKSNIGSSTVMPTRTLTELKGCQRQ